MLEQIEEETNIESKDIKESKMHRGLSTVLNSAHKSHLDTLFEDRLT